MSTFEDTLLERMRKLEQRMGSTENAVTVLGDHANGKLEDISFRLASVEQTLEEMKLAHIAANTERAKDKACMDALVEQLKAVGITGV